MANSLYRDLVRLLEEAGCRFVRAGKGSHQIWYSPITKRNFPVSSTVTSHHTANEVLKQAGLTKAF
jgi:predicted RNA binding protein YcfA (HicA-like mRNA interferase family)